MPSAHIVFIEKNNVEVIKIPIPDIVHKNWTFRALDEQCNFTYL